MSALLAPLISALASAGGLLVDKIILSREQLALKVFLPLLFVALFLITLVLAPFFGAVDYDIARLPNNLFLLLLMVVIAIAWNIFFYQSIQKEKVHQHELIMMTQPLVTVMLAAVFFPEELNWLVFALALVASVALIIAKTERAHLKIDRAAYNLFLAVILISVESVIIRELLYTYSPVALYAVRTGFIALFFWAYYHPKWRRVSTVHYRLVALSALIGVVQMVSRFYAFQEIGIIYTVLVTVMAPVIIFLASWEILHERIRPRVVAGSLVILVCVAWATIIQFS
ncbi:MAG: DMT family transporter [Patescibacteria group bacterium]